MAIPDYQTLMLPVLQRTLTHLMYDYGIGVRPGRSLAVKRVDEGYFEGEV